jgi:predicted ATP-grasp superfamily ATP-dependent carboligase
MKLNELQSEIASLAGSTSPCATDPGNRPRDVQRKQVGAVVVGGDFVGLGIVRRLGRHGIPVCVIDDEHSISQFSRYCTRSVRVESLREQSRIAEQVMEIGHKYDLQGWVLYPTREEIVASFAQYRPMLAQYFRVPTPGWDTTKWAWDKRNTYKLAETLGIPTPRTWYPRDLSELESIDADFPLIIKPAIKEHFIYMTKVKAWKATTRSDLRDCFTRALAIVGPNEVMVQELILGSGFGYCAFFKGGQPLGSMVARYLRQHPPEFGRAGTCIESADIPLLESFSQRFLNAIDYYGLVELEYKFDNREATYKLLDVNARAWGYHFLGPHAGVDFTWLLFADQVGHRAQPCRAKAGVRWVRLVTDLPTGIVQILRRSCGVRQYLSSLAHCDVEAVFSVTDPLPGIAELALLPYLALKRGY